MLRSTSRTVFRSVVRAVESRVRAVTMTPMEATDSFVWAWVTSSATAMRNTAVPPQKAFLLVMALEGRGQTTSPDRASSWACSSFRKHSQKYSAAATKQMAMISPVLTMKSQKV